MGLTCRQVVGDEADGRDDHKEYEFYWLNRRDYGQARDLRVPANPFFRILLPTFCDNFNNIRNGISASRIS